MPRIPGSSAGNIGIGATQIRGAGLAATPLDAVEGGMPGLDGRKDGSDRAGRGFGGLADMAQVFDNARRENEAQKGKVEFLSGVRDLRTQIEQDPDQSPENLLTKYDTGVQGLRQSLTERYKNDEAVLGKILPHFDNFNNEQSQHIRQLSFKRTVDQGRADGMVNDEVLLSTLSKASRPEDFDWVVQLNDDDVASKLGTGIYSAVEAEHRKKTFEAVVDRQRKVFLEEQRLNGVHSALFKNFGKNPNGAVSYLENPDNWDALGIGHKEALHFISVFDSQAAREKRRSDEARTAGERSEKEGYFRALEKGDYAGAETLLAKARSIPGSERRSMREALKKDQWDDDPGVVADTLRGVWSGEITDPNQITSRMGNGLSIKTTQSLRKDIETITKDTPPFAGAPNYYKESVDRFNLVYAGDDGRPIKEHAARFQAALAYELGQQKLSPYDHRVTDIADTLLKKSEWAKQRTVAGVGLWSFDKEGTEFQRMFEAGTLPGQGIPQTAPGARPGFAPKPTSIQNIPRAEYDLVKSSLSKAGRDTSDETVLSVWLANRDKLKGSK